MNEPTIDQKKKILEDRMQKIEEWKNEYWKDNNPSIPDLKYAKYLKKTIELCESLKDNVEFKQPFLDILNIIEFPKFENAEKIRRDTPMLSINNVFNFKTLYAWAQKLSRTKNEVFSLFLKFDGISTRTELSRTLLITRGSKDIYIGQNISKIYPFLNIDSIDNSSDFNGEIIVKFSDFDSYNKQFFSNKPYKTPRSMVQGLINSDIDKLPTEIKLTAVQHNKYSWELEFKDFSEETLFSIYDEIRAKFEDYPSDGIVIKLKDEQYFNELGHNNKYPYGSVAWKFEEEIYESTLLDVILQRGKFVMTPVSRIIPINLKNGTQIKGPSFRNAKILVDSDAHIGDTVQVIYRAEVNPHIVRILPGKERISLGDKIKKCGCSKNTDIEYREPFFYCTGGNECPEGISKNIYECCKILGIEDIGQPTISKLIELYDIQDFVDLILLEYIKIRKIPGYAENRTKKLYDQLQKVKLGVYDYKILSCLGIRGIGVTISEDICKRFTLKELFELTPSQIESFKIKNVGPERSIDISEGLMKNIELLKKIAKTIKVIPTKGEIKEFKGIMCFSGKFPQQKQVYARIAQVAGYKVVENVTENVDYLVHNGPISNNYTKAEKNGKTKILKLPEFMIFINKKL